MGSMSTSGDNAPIDLPAANAFWEAYVAARPDLAIDREVPSFEHFGDGPPLTDELLDLVRGGGKRATATLVAEFALEDQPLPRVLSHWVACDSAGRPGVIMRTTALRVATFATVDADFAAAEGEDDGSLESWREGHRRYWTRLSASLGIDFDEQRSPVLLERFEVVWPPEHMDAHLR